jgi:uncharacterized lipoprotein
MSGGELLMQQKVASTMRIAAISIFLAGIALLPGCKSPLNECHETNKDYAGAPELPPLQAPAGLEAPNTRNSLKIPPLNTPERVRGKEEPCLAAPPPFSTPKAADSPKPAEARKPASPPSSN